MNWAFSFSFFSFFFFFRFFGWFFEKLTFQFNFLLRSFSQVPELKFDAFFEWVVFGLLWFTRGKIIFAYFYNSRFFYFSVNNQCLWLSSRGLAIRAEDSLMGSNTASSWMCFSHSQPLDKDVTPNKKYCTPISKTNSKI